jgi:CO/xanthine dehydrogenase Mo-binding subunit
MTGPRITRRRFGKAVGALTIAFSLAPHSWAADVPKLPGSLANNKMLDAWLSIKGDGTVAVFTGKVELGQGILTALHQIVADELDVAPERITMISGDTARTPDEGFTSGSQSIEYGGTALRYACAEARGVLLARAIEHFGLAGKTLNMLMSVVDGTILVGSQDRTVTYWELAGGLDLHREATATTAPKPPQALTHIGKSAPRLDIPAKVTGGASYVQDIRLPGLLFGRISRPPTYGAELIAFDEERVRRMPGVRLVLRDGRFLGVIAEREEQAIAARDELARAAAWRETQALPPPADIYKHLKSLPAEDHVISNKGGDVPARDARLSFSAAYTKPYTAHASIGPSCAIAQWKEGQLTVWTQSQGVFPLRRDLAKALDLDVDKIRCIHVQGSGCYGHNGADDVALDAALLARAANGPPVKVQWMRDDEFAWEPLGPAMSVALTASLDELGMIIDWTHDVWTNAHSTRPQKQGCNLLAAWHLAQPKAPGKPGIIPQPAGGGDRNAVPLYDFARQRVTHHFIPQMPIRVSALRALGAYANVFAIESFMDEIAKAAKVDPVEFRMRHLSDPRASAIVKAAASFAGWQPGTPGGTGKGHGIGFAKYKNLSAYLAVVVEVEVDRGSGAVRVTKATAAIDAGQVVNPDGLINQTEGGIIQAASWTLKEQVGFSPAHITSRDWVRYPILTFPEVPEIKVTVLDRPTERSLGAGEAAQGPTAAAIGNAIAHATGARIRDLPLVPERIKAAFG